MDPRCRTDPSITLKGGLEWRSLEWSGIDTKQTLVDDPPHQLEPVPTANWRLKNWVLVIKVVVMVLYFGILIVICNFCGFKFFFFCIFYRVYLSCRIIYFLKNIKLSFSKIHQGSIRTPSWHSLVHQRTKVTTKNIYIYIYLMDRNSTDQLINICRNTSIRCF